MRQNDERIGSSAPAPPAAPQNSAGLLNYVIPTEIVDLPSKGRFYAEGHPLHDKEYVEIKHMTAKEEDILTSASLVEKGVVLDHLIQSLLIDNNINAKTLFGGDRNAILLNARVNGYGPDYEATSQCSSCGHFTNAKFDLLGIKNKEMNLDSEPALQLPKTKYPVTFKYLVAHEEELLQKEVEKRSKLGYGDNVLTTFLKFIVTSVNGIKASDSSINEFIENMPAADAKYIKNYYAETKPDVDFSLEVECESCSHTERRVVPITAQFFWPQS
jgi:hypothetical protein